jgi:hypothetical protein
MLKKEEDWEHILCPLKEKGTKGAFPEMWIWQN